MLNTHTSISPTSRSIDCTSSTTWSSRRASLPKAFALPPSASICATSGCSASAWRRVTQATKPSRAKRRAMAPPVASPAPTTSATFCATLLQPGERRRRKNRVADLRQDRAALLGLGARLLPFGVGHEAAPDLFALGQVFPLQHVVQYLVVIADQRGPEAGRTDAVLVPDFERDGLETLDQVRQAAGHAAIDAQFVNHGGIPFHG